MMQIRDSVKRLLLTRLPESVLDPVRRVYYARLLARDEELKEPDLRAAEGLVRTGDRVMDIGANIGVYTKFLSRWVGNDGCVYSIEPIPSTFRVLASNVQHFRLTNVKAINCAVSSANGLVTMEVPLGRAGWEDFYLARVVTEGSNGGSLRRVQVQCRSIDSLCEDWPYPLSLIKCDVEGHELYCVNGATRTIQRWSPAWLVEVWGDPDDPASEARVVFDRLASFGYQAYWFDGTGVRRRDRGERSVNYWFLREDHVERLRKQHLVTE